MHFEITRTGMTTCDKFKDCYAHIKSTGTGIRAWNKLDQWNLLIRKTRLSSLSILIRSALHMIISFLGVYDHIFAYFLHPFMLRVSHYFANLNIQNYSYVNREWVHNDSNTCSLLRHYNTYSLLIDKENHFKFVVNYSYKKLKLWL